MAKMTISESRLHELIQESIYEVLQEAQYDEGLGHWLGNAFPTMKNKWNNFKGDFNAGRNKARYDNRDYDSYSHYGDEGNEFRNFGGQEYGAHRYNTTVDRNARLHNTEDRSMATRVCLIQIKEAVEPTHHHNPHKIKPTHHLHRYRVTLI